MKKLLFSIFLIILALTGIGLTNKINTPSNKNNVELNITKIESNSEEKYVQSLADELNTTYEDAYEINKKENEEYLLENKTGLDEIIKYKTVYKRFPVVDKRVWIEMGVEVKLVYSQATSNGLEIMGVVASYMVTSDESNYTVDGGGYNKEVSKKRARISRTAVIVPKVFKTGIVTTPAKTYVINIKLGDL